MGVMRKCTTSGILAVLAATVVACGSLGAGQQAGSASAAGMKYVAGTGGGTTYLMADGTNGMGAANDRRQTDPAAALTGGYCPREWCPPLEP